MKQLQNLSSLQQQKDKNLRNTQFYKTLTPLSAISIIEDNDDLCETVEGTKQYMTTWQYLHDTRLAYSLQGWYGRTAQNLIQNKQILK